MTKINVLCLKCGHEETIFMVNPQWVTSLRKMIKNKMKKEIASRLLRDPVRLC